MKKRSRKNIGLIYTVKNKITGKFYVGATTSTIEMRKRDHIQKSNNGHGHEFHEAISSYGADAFSWEQIDTANCSNELALKEKQYVLSFNAKAEGYNSDSGGGFKKTIYQYSVQDGSLIKAHDSLTYAGNVINATKQDISRACLSVNHLLSGYYWSYEYKEPFTPNKDNRKKNVTQFSLEGIKIAEYSSIAEATRETGVNKSSIAKVCRGERNQAGGYIWIYNK